MEDCLFCRIANGKIPAAKIYEDEKTLSFLDIMPANKGHCLVIPKTHSETLIEMGNDDLVATMETLKKVAKALSLSFGNSSYNLVMNNGKEAGQIVNHAHMHLIPRFKKDRLRIKWSHLKYADKEANAYAKQIKKFI
jgi:histidine triad (HIT) family protein